jgi:uncharacterized protein YdhG (YjbR/CyaY superfamily)
MNKSFATIDDYITSFPEEVQPVLQQVRDTVRHAAPGAEETISYGMPTLTLDGRYLVYFAGWKNHISVYPAPVGDDAFERQIAPYRASTGTLKFPLRKPVPYDLIERVVQLLVEQRASDGAAG